MDPANEVRVLMATNTVPSAEFGLFLVEKELGSSEYHVTYFENGDVGVECRCTVEDLKRPDPRPILLNKGVYFCISLRDIGVFNAPVLLSHHFDSPGTSYSGNVWVIARLVYSDCSLIDCFFCL